MKNGILKVCIIPNLHLLIDLLSPLFVSLFMHGVGHKDCHNFASVFIVEKL